MLYLVIHLYIHCIVKHKPYYCILVYSFVFVELPGCAVHTLPAILIRWNVTGKWYDQSELGDPYVVRYEPLVAGVTEIFAIETEILVDGDGYKMFVGVQSDSLLVIFAVVNYIHQMESRRPISDSTVRMALTPDDE